MAVRPMARENGLVVELLANEAMVYNTADYQCSCLNRTAAAVWKLCDGRRTVPEIAGELRDELGAAATNDVVWLALAQLSEAGLLVEPVNRADAPGEEESRGSGKRLTRREAARRFAQIGLGAALVPAVLSIVAPTPAMAGSAPNGSECGDASFCASNCCCTVGSVCLDIFVCTEGLLGNCQQPP
jgi:hypothetical protein